MTHLWILKQFLMANARLGLSLPMLQADVQGYDFRGLWGMADSFWEKSIRIVAILVVSYLVAHVLLMLIDKFQKIVARNGDGSNLTANTRRVETVTAILRNAAIVFMVLLTVFILLSEVGINIAPLIAGAGIAGVAIGFGAQSLVKDLFYGFFIILENQFGIGDTIQIGDSIGQVEVMTLRKVTLRDMEGRLHIIPNGEASKVIVYSHGWSNMNINLEITSNTSIDKAFEVINGVNREIYKANPTFLLEEPRTLGVEALGPSGTTIKVLAKTPPQKHFEISRLYRKKIKEAFDEAGIEIPIMPPAMPPKA